MTERFIRDLAKRFGLTVLKRITTGNERNHFATFELAGKGAIDAWKSIKGEAQRGFHRLAVVDNKEHPDCGQMFIELQSVYCEMGKDGGE